MDILAVRTGLKAAAATVIPRSYEFMPDAVTPPVFFVAEVEIEFDKAFNRGMDDLTFTCRVLVSRSDDKRGQAALDGYLKGSGATSIKQALQADPTLGGACHAVHVMRVTGYGLYEHGKVEYYGAEFFVRVIGSGS